MKFVAFLISASTSTTSFFFFFTIVGSLSCGCSFSGTSKSKSSSSFLPSSLAVCSPLRSSEDFRSYALLSRGETETLEGFESFSSCSGASSMMVGARSEASSNLLFSVLINCNLVTSLSGRRQKKIRPLSQVVIKCFILFVKHMAVVICPGWHLQSGYPVFAS